MKIVSWNVNGLRAVMRKGDWAWVATSSAHLVCLQEIKSYETQIIHDYPDSLDGYHTYFHSAERAGYSGVLSLAAYPPDEVIFGLGESRFDVEGRALLTRFGDIWVINVYVPNGKRDHSRVGYKLEFYDLLLRKAQQIVKEGEGVVICGDINTAHQEIDLTHPKENENTTGFLPEERAWISRFIEEGFHDVYRERYPERVQYTWWSYQTRARDRNVGWRLDYFLVSENLLPRVKKVEIFDQVMGSDHCPIGLEID